MTIILVIHVALAVLKMFILSPLASIGDIMSCMILYCGISQHNFCNVLMYMIFCLFDSFQLATTIGFLIQTGAFGQNGGLSNSSMIQGNANGLNMGFVYGFIIVMFIFYCVAVFCSFQTYKEFKAIYQEQLGDQEAGRMIGNPINYGALRKIKFSKLYIANGRGGQSTTQNVDSQQSAFHAFQGEGKRLGDYK